MQALLQRVARASVSVEHSAEAAGNEIVGAIDQGLLVFLGLEPGDTFAAGVKLLERVFNYRVFSDAQGRMNRSLRDVDGGLLLVSQFTLAADTRQGLRPGFSTAMAPAEAAGLFASLYEFAAAQHQPLAGGRFGANMQVSLVNDGPVTFLLRSR